MRCLLNGCDFFGRSVLEPTVLDRLILLGEVGADTRDLDGEKIVELFLSLFDQVVSSPLLYSRLLLPLNQNFRVVLEELDQLVVLGQVPVGDHSDLEDEAQAVTRNSVVRQRQLYLLLCFDALDQISQIVFLNLLLRTSVILLGRHIALAQCLERIQHFVKVPVLALFMAHFDPMGWADELLLTGTDLRERRTMALDE